MYLIIFFVSSKVDLNQSKTFFSLSQVICFCVLVVIVFIVSLFSLYLELFINGFLTFHVYLKGYERNMALVVIQNRHLSKKFLEGVETDL